MLKGEFGHKRERWHVNTERFILGILLRQCWGIDFEKCGTVLISWPLSRYS